MGLELLANDASAPASTSASTTGCTANHSHALALPLGRDEITPVDGQLNLVVALPSA